MSGSCEERFAAVADAFVGNFTERGELGAAVTVALRGKTVVEQPTTTRRTFGPNARSFGHFGTGGAVGFADPGAGLAFGYVMNDVIPRWQSSRNRALVDALYASL